LVGEVLVSVMQQIRGASNAKAKSEFGWRLRSSELAARVRDGPWLIAAGGVCGWRSHLR